jgi:hypothetical protein
MKKFSFILALFGLFTLLGGPTACKRATSGTAAAPPTVALPDSALNARVHLSEVNCWTEGDTFYTVGLMHSHEPLWGTYWLKLALLDGQKRLIETGGDSCIVVKTHAGALPPHGQTAFMTWWKISELGATPDSVLLHSARCVEVTPGAILMSNYTHGGDSLHTGDSGPYASVYGTIVNPLPLPALPELSILLYGPDQRLRWAQAMSLQTDTNTVRANAYGPMKPNEKRQFGANIYVNTLPPPLRTARWGKIDVLAYEKR